ncbi:MAG: hypothetical protein K6E85_14330 [Lachnospiraceae bacterium]|nr:hypothetical protein [Lachnospiraceae bacterium]
MEEKPVIVTGSGSTTEPAVIQNSKKQVICQVAKVVVFLAIFCVILYFLCDIFEYANNYMSQRYERYKDFEPDTIDAVIIGTSGVDRSWIAAKGFDKFGLAVYPLSIDAMPCWTALDMIKEAYRYQNPKLVVIDMRMFVIYDPSYKVNLSKTRARRVIDTLDFFSPNRLNAINSTQKVMSVADPGESRFEPSYFFTFIQYHSKWSDTGFNTFEEIGCKASKYLGFYLTSYSVKAKKLKKTKWTDVRKPLTDIAEQSLYEILDYCEQNNIELLFLDSPHYLSKNEVKRTNTLCDILDSRGINWVSYTGQDWYYDEEHFEEIITVDEEGKYVVNHNGIVLRYATKEKAINYLTKHTFDRKLHFYDSSHLNFEGAAIFTRLFGDYLVNNYDLGDHSDDPKYEEWENVYKAIKKKIKKYNAAKTSKKTKLTEEEQRDLEEEQREIEEEQQLLQER